MSNRPKTNPALGKSARLASLEEVRQELMKDPLFRLEYDSLLFREHAGKLLQEARIRAGLTQTEVADRARTKQSVIARLESGRGGFPSLALLDRVSRAIGMRLTLNFEPAKAA